MGLLIGDANQIRQLLLGEAQYDAALADPSPDMAINVLGSCGGSLHV